MAHPIANHHGGRGSKEQTGCSAEKMQQDVWPENVLKMNPGRRGRPMGPTRTRGERIKPLQVVAH